MDSSGVLLALEERKKWRERRERIRERVKQLERRKAYLQHELARVRKKVSEYNVLLARLKDAKIEGERPLPPAALR
jgi:chromosome segregation ATPase